MQINGMPGFPTLKSGLGKRRAAKVSPSQPSAVRGFALVVTLSLMILLTLIAVGLLSLSAISLRGASQAQAQAEAQANARLALMLAIGELQKHSGPDTRVTAPAAIVDKDSPPLTGVWRSWEGTDHETRGTFAGRPVPPNYSAKKTAASGGRFLTWLVSGSESGVSPTDPASLAHKAPTGNSVALLSGGTLGKGDDREVHLVPARINSKDSFAWWVSGENQKARLPHPYPPTDDSAAGWSVIAKSHAVANPKHFGLDALLDDPSPAEKAITLHTADLIAAQGGKTRAHGFFLDLSANSVGLLTNTATGGWRKDLSLLSESWGSQPSSGLPLFQITPTENSAAAIPSSGSPVAAKSMLYPWAAYRGGAGDPPIYQHGPVTSWANLIDWATHYKRVSASANGRITTPIHSVSIVSQDRFAFLHKVRVLPLVARMHWVFSHSARLIPNSRSELYEPRLLLTPVITMWNPYNVEITSPASLHFRIPRPLPAALKYTIDGQANPNYNAVMGGGLNNLPALGANALNFRIGSGFTLIPGETRLFSPKSLPEPVASNTEIVLEPGYRSGGGHFFPVKGPAGQALALPGSASIKADAKFDTSYTDHGNNKVADGVGIYLDMNLPDSGDSRHLVYRMVYAPEIANAVYPALTNLASATLSQCVSNPQPFLSTIFGARTASNTHLAAKGFVQSSPLVNYTAMGKKDEEERTIGRHYGGTGHPVNSPFDYSFVKHASGGDSQLPNGSDATGRGYIITGFNKADGLSRCVIAELPVRPLASLGELTNWDLRYENPIPPFAINLIGNSDATPLLPSDKVVNSNDAGLAVNLQYDDSYCANHLLFDDWFVSSITPDPTHFGPSGPSQQETYAGFLTGDKPLANRAYRPIREDSSAAKDTAALHDRNVKPVDSWRKIASRVEVQGMFNVNSTSVTAWRAMLGHARDQRVPHIRESGRGWSAALSDATDHVWSRFSIAGDAEASTPGSSGAFPEATEFAGYRSVDDDFLDALAEEVVAQVRNRGPFLSLSEFVNRQLSSGNLALAGTIQAALNKLAENTTTDPFGEIKALSTVATTDPPSPPRVTYDEEYKFRDAAAGYSAYGLPGWTRQADILRPLAPILSARDDTFSIRTYGDARDAQGRVLARVWCEATVRRTRGFIDPAEAADLTTAPSLPANRIFGRRFELISFRWLAPGEV